MQVMTSLKSPQFLPNIPNLPAGSPNFPRNIPNFAGFQDILRGVHDSTQRHPGQRCLQVLRGRPGKQLRGEV